MSLDTALKSYADAFAAGFKSLGILEYRAPQRFAEPIPLGPVLKDYFARLRMSESPQVGGELQLMLFTLDGLEAAQHGWRWVRNKGGPVTENPNWNKHWIVIADRNGDAIVVDDSTDGGTVSGHIGPRDFRIADDLASFFEVMAEAMMLESATFNYDVLDQDFNQTPNFLNAVSAIALRVLGPEGEAGFMEFFFG